ncbi:MAG: transglycosylase SLT domain-containing protein [Pontibacterium sp.]
MRIPFFLLTLLFSVSFAQAAQIDTQRSQFQAQYKKLVKGTTVIGNKNLQALADYPLYPYLKFQSLKNQLPSLKQSQVDAFSGQFSDTPLPWQLNRAWLRHLFQKKQWKAYRAAHAKQPASGDLYSCRLQIARLNSGARTAALKAAESLWLKGQSQHKTCDPLFNAWKKTGQPTSSLALKRFWLAAAAGNTSLAKYIERAISTPADKKQSALFWKIQRNPAQVRTLKASQLSTASLPVLVTYGYKRWARNDRIAATTSWLKHRKQFSPLQAGLITGLDKSLALKLAANYDKQAEQLISKLDPDYQYPEVTEWRARLALSQEDWAGVNRAIARLPEKQKNSERWRYWQAITGEQLQNNPKSTTQLTSISGTRSFYGFLAAELNKTPFALNQQSSLSGRTELEKIASIPGFVRARELFHLGMTVAANREWALASKKLDKQQQLLAGYLALNWGWHNRAINVAIDTRQWNELGIRFPYPHQALFNKNAQKQNIDKTWPLAIARQESAFRVNAKSHAGARGLMQLMPATAKLTAKKHKVPYRHIAQLNNPKINIALGTAYLGEMHRRFNQNKAYATAAYNAGPHRVKRWLTQRGHLPLDIWIETIPFKETRRYVQNVLAFRVIYERLAGRAGSLLTEDEASLLALNTKEDKASAL